MARLIDAEALKEAIDGLFFPHSSQEINEVIDAQPTIDAQPVQHGRWIKENHGGAIYSACSECGAMRNLPWWWYCGKCGARMDGGEEDVKH